MFETLEEAFQFAGGLPIPTWMPERYESYQIMLNVMADEKQELLREFCWIILTPTRKTLSFTTGPAITTLVLQ